MMLALGREKVNAPENSVKDSIFDRKFDRILESDAII